MNYDILINDKNLCIYKCNNVFYCISYDKLISQFDKLKANLIVHNINQLTITNKKHLDIFKNKIKNKEIVLTRF